MLGKNFSRQQSEIFFLIFPRICFGMSCKLSPRERKPISRKSKKNIKNMSIVQIVVKVKMQRINIADNILIFFINFRRKNLAFHVNCLLGKLLSAAVVTVNPKGLTFTILYTNSAGNKLGPVVQS